MESQDRNSKKKYRCPRAPLAGLIAVMITVLGCSDPKGPKAPKNQKSPATKPNAHATPGAPNAAGDWCAGHAIPESKCTKCNPGLIAKFKQAKDWCAGHGFPESACPQCNPVAPPGSPSAPRAAAKDWCAGHNLPESKCTKCNPELTARFKQAGDWCVTHGYPESACPQCKPVAPPAGTKPPRLFIPGARIRFRSASIERAAGITTVPATKVSLSRRVSCTARIDYNRDRLAEVRSPVQALVKRVHIQLGTKVRKGSELFTLSSAQIGVLKSRLIAAGRRYRVAKTQLKRQKALHKSGATSTQALEASRVRLAEASSTLAAIHQSLRIGGISARGFSGAFTLVAPIGGTVVRRPAVLGAKAGPGTSLATLADTSSMWALLDVNEWDANRVRTGQSVTVRVDGLAGQVFEGKIKWLSTEVNAKTRYVRAHAEIANPRGLLRAHQFARATIGVAASRGGVTVPVVAVQRLGQGHVVFVRLNNGVYEPRAVQLGRTDGMRVHVAGRVKNGDLVVTTGAFLLRTELSKDAIGAGCCEVEKPGGR